MERISVMQRTTWKLRLPLQLVFRRSLLAEIISSLLIVLFVYAAVTKIIDYNTFVSQLSKSPFITEFAVEVAWALPIGELLIGIALAFKITRLIGFYGALFLMTMFSAYIYTMLNYSYYIPCSCGGILSKMSWNTHFWFNVVFVVLSLLGIFILTTKSKIVKGENKF